MALSKCPPLSINIKLKSIVTRANMILFSVNGNIPIVNMLSRDVIFEPTGLSPGPKSGPAWLLRNLT